MKTADPELMRAINRFHVLDTIRRHGPISRTEISAHTELSNTTVSAITASLIDDGLIGAQRLGTIRNPARGRPRVMLELNADATRVVGVKIGSRGIIHVVTNFQGDVVGELSLPIRVDRQAADVVADLIEDGVRRCVADAGLTLAAIKSMCVALPGVVEHASGRVRRSPVLKDQNVNLGEAVASRLGLPILVESDANAAAVAAHWFRSCRELDDFLVVTVERSLGLGVMHGGQLFRGARGISFSLGELAIGSFESACVELGRLSNYADEAAMVEVIEHQPDSRDAIRVGGGMALVLEQLKAGNDDAARAARRAGEALGITIANLVMLFSPPRVVLIGSTLVLGDHLLADLRKALTAALPPWLSDISELEVDNFDDSAWARGAAGAALRELYESPWGTTGPAKPAKFERHRDR